MAETPDTSADPATDAGAPPRSGILGVLVHISGRRRGDRDVLASPSVRLGSSDEAELRFDHAEGVQGVHATVEWAGASYHVRAEPGSMVEVNGSSVDSRELQEGDLIRVGHGGPLLRFRLCQAGWNPSAW